MYRQLQASLMALFAVAVSAAEESGRFAAPAQAVAPQQIGVGSGFLQIFGSLLLVIATIVVVGWVARKLKTLPRRSSAVFQVVDEVALGSKERVVLVEVDGVRLVVGVGEGRVTLLHRSDVPASEGQLDDAAASLIAGPVPPRFVDLLKKGLGK
jgi:flagellar protein FliO/FliZ